MTLACLDHRVAEASKRDQKSRWVFYTENINPVSVDDLILNICDII